MYNIVYTVHPLYIQSLLYITTLYRLNTYILYCFIAVVALVAFLLGYITSIGKMSIDFLYYCIHGICAYLTVQYMVHVHT